MYISGLAATKTFNGMFKLFFTAKVECPRCLGKGNVDGDDIKRLGQELRWIPGKCAYCNGKGRVAPKKVSKVKPDNAYLTTSIGQDERKRLFEGDEGALQRAKWLDAQVNIFILQIEYLFFMGKMDAECIADFFLIESAETEVSEQERQELIEYIDRVISRKKKHV